MNILYLPDDIIIYILYHCRYNNIIILKNVCKNFYDIIKTNDFWKNKFIFTKGIDFYNNIFYYFPITQFEICVKNIDTFEDIIIQNPSDFLKNENYLLFWKLVNEYKYKYIN